MVSFGCPVETMRGWAVVVHGVPISDGVTCGMASIDAPSWRLTIEELRLMRLLQN
jgi:hypothetical protein